MYDPCFRTAFSRSGVESFSVGFISNVIINSEQEISVFPTGVLEINHPLNHDDDPDKSECSLKPQDKATGLSEVDHRTNITGSGQRAKMRICMTIGRRILSVILPDYVVDHFRVVRGADQALVEALEGEAEMVRVHP